MENHFYKSQVSLMGTILSLIACTVIWVLIKYKTKVEWENFIFYLAICYSSIILWCTTEIHIKWKDNSGKTDESSIRAGNPKTSDTQWKPTESPFAYPDDQN